MTFEIYKSKSEWRWRLVARNGRTIADSAEGYRRRVDCARQVARIQAGALDASVVCEKGKP